MSLKRRFKNQMTFRLRQFAEVAQRFGWNITPDHFYADIPKFRTLRRTDYWRRPAPVGETIRGAPIDAQLYVAREWMAPYADELRGFDVYKAACEKNGEPGYGPMECQLLYAFVRGHRPPRVTMVGCGVSTAVVLMAAEREGYRPDVVCVEPYPTGMLEEESRAGRLRLIREQAQTVQADALLDIDEGGLLFVDSTHTTHVGSEVNRLILEILPRLNPGVHAHFHDIFLPYDYHPAILRDLLFFGGESTLLHAFLLCNDQYELEISQYMLHVFAQDEMKRLFPGYVPRPVKDGVFTTKDPTYGEQTPEKGYYPSAMYLRRV